MTKDELVAKLHNMIIDSKSATGHPERTEGVLTAATVGTFDGVHRGHRAVLDTLTSEAAAKGLHPLTFTFDRHPLEVIRPDKAPGMLTLPATRDSLIAASGATPIELPFTESLASMTAGTWMRHLADNYGVRLMVIGYDNTFGSDGVHLNANDFKLIGKRCGIDVIPAPVIEGICSSAVRKAVATGDVARAAEMLGRPFALEGIVVHGAALGTGLGYPTANLAPDPRLIIPARGVYIAEAALPDGTSAPAMVNVGAHPTVGALPTLSVEANILGFSGSLYSLPLTLRFYSRLRDEKKFPSLEALKMALADDSAAVAAFFRDKQR